MNIRMYIRMYLKCGNLRKKARVFIKKKPALRLETVTRGFLRRRGHPRDPPPPSPFAAGRRMPCKPQRLQLRLALLAHLLTLEEDSLRGYPPVFFILFFLKNDIRTHTVV